MQDSARDGAAAGASALRAGDDEREDGGEDEQAGDEVEAAGEAAGLVLDPADHGRADEAAEIADRVDRGDAGRRGRAGQEHRRHAHSGGLAALMPTLTSAERSDDGDDGRRAPPASTSPAAATRQAMTTCQVRSPVRSEWRAHRIMAITATVGGMALRKPTAIVRQAEALDDLRRPDAERVEAGGGAEVDRAPAPARADPQARPDAVLGGRGLAGALRVHRPSTSQARSSSASHFAFSGRSVM